MALIKEIITDVPNAEKSFEDIKIVRVIIPAYRTGNTISRVIQNIGEEPFSAGTQLEVYIDINGPDTDRNGKELNTQSHAHDALVGLIRNRLDLSIVTNLERHEAGSEVYAVNRMIRLIRKSSDKLPSEELNGRDVLIIHDDMYWQRGAVALLSLMMQKKPYLFAIGQRPRPVSAELDPNQTKLPAQISAYQQERTSLGQILTRMSAIKEGILGDEGFPPEVQALDRYMVLAALSRAEDLQHIFPNAGYGILSIDKFAVYNDLPTTWMGLIHNELMHAKAAQQFDSTFPEMKQYDEIVWEDCVNKSFKERLITKIFRDVEGYGLHVRLIAPILMKYLYQKGCKLELKNPSLGSSRERGIVNY